MRLMWLAERPHDLKLTVPPAEPKSVSTCNNACAPSQTRTVLTRLVKKLKPSPSCTNTSREITGDDCNCGQIVGNMWACRAGHHLQRLTVPPSLM
jgi:hypothetical protein